MFIAYPEGIAKHLKFLIDEWTGRNRLTTHRHGKFVVRCSERWTVSKWGNFIEFFEGMAYEWPTCRARPPAERRARLSNSIGYFTSILLGADTLEVVRSLYRATDIFYTESDGMMLTCSELAVLVALRGGFAKQRIDFGYCHDFIAHLQKFDGHTSFENINEVMLGECIRMSKSGIIGATFVNRPIVPNGDIVDTLRDTLAAFTQPFDSTVLMFSGGLDSSTLLWTLLANGTRPLVLHSESDPDARDSEYRDASAVALDLGCEIQRLVPEREDYSQAFTISAEGRSSSPHDVPIFRSCTSARSDLSIDDTSLLVTGHGGDHVFVQNPGSNSCLAALQAGRVLEYIGTVRKLSRLKGRRGVEIVCDNVRCLVGLQFLAGSLPAWLPRRRQRSSRRSGHYLIRDLDSRAAKFSHLSAILQALQSVSVPRTGPLMLAPLLLQNVIGHVIEIPVEDMFTETHDRVTLRESIYRRSGKSFAWRRTKRASSAHLFELLSQSEANLLDLIDRSDFVPLLHIDRRVLLAEVRQNCRVALNESFKHIVNLYKIEAHIRSIEHQSARLTRP
ncbi:asparagine synthase-related protein [Burkholderia sp. 22313]|uniref:asparagine synthase-related protein n=1 Tax=Burkholderia sp. 22313 TaxID=3453908 RepID=UPI003F83AD54